MIGLSDLTRKRVIGIMKLFRNSFVVLVILTALAQAQQESPQPRAGQSTVTVQGENEVGEGEVVRVSASLVSVPVSVIDRQGKYVVDLQQQDFQIFEDGVEQSITHFSNLDQPFSVVLLMDTSGSTALLLGQMKEAAKSFVTQLRSVDTVQPVYFHGEIRPLTTNSINNPSLLGAAIDQMKSGPLDLGTRLYDAVDFALGILRPVSGRKAIILFSDGENTWGKATMKSTLHQAEESDVIIYTLQYSAAPAQKYLRQLADKTGGRYFMAADLNAISKSFAEVAEELRRQYVLGYQPDELAKNLLERKIRVKVHRPRVAVRARKSYTISRPG